MSTWNLPITKPDPEPVGDPDAQYGPNGVAFVVRRRLATAYRPTVDEALQNRRAVEEACRRIDVALTPEERKAWGTTEVEVDPAQVEDPDALTLARVLAELTLGQRSAQQVIRWFDAHGEAAMNLVDAAQTKHDSALALALLLAAVNFGIVIENNWPYPPDGEPVIRLATRAAQAVTPG